MTPEQRLLAIDKLIVQFEQSVSGAETALLERISEAAKRLLENPVYLSTVLRDWQPVWAGLIQDLATGLLDVADLNRRDFDALGIAPADLTGATSDLLLALGVTGTGLLIEGGYLAAILKDTSIGRQVISAVTDAKLRGLDEGGMLARLKPLLRGTKDSPGIVGKLLSQLDTQPHVEADRVMQRAVAIQGNLTAALYLGGLVDGSRAFCQARNAKVFLASEIERFGTSKDAYGGYQDKAKGYFSGKPKSGYDPFTQAGGVRCRHHWNYVSNAEALRRRDDLEEVNGVLRIKRT